MPLQDVSNDQSMISWLQQSGHGHLLGDQQANASPPSPPLNNSLGLGTSSATYPPPTSSPPQNSVGGSGGFNPTSAPPNALHRSVSFPQADHHLTNAFAGGHNPASPPIIPPTDHYNTSPYNQQSSPINFSSTSPTHLISANANQQQLDADIENMKRDPNTRVVQRPPEEDVVYKQRVFVRYLQPPTPPVGGTIIVREKQPPPPPPDPPIVIKRAPPAPPTPPPVIIRERPPPLPAPEGTTVIDKIVPPGPKPQRQVVIEQYPPLPPKPQDVIIERWLPMAPRQRRILYERLPPTSQIQTRPVIVQYGPPQVRVQRELITAPGIHLPNQQIGGRTDINQLLGNQQIQSSFLPSSLVSYNPHTAIQPNYGGLGQSQPNVVILQNGQPNTLPPSIYGTPLTCVCTPNQPAGLGAYGSSVSSLPLVGQASGQSMIYNVPDTVPIDNILRQLGIDPSTIQRSGSHPSAGPHTSVSHVWDAASHANPLHTNPTSAVSHVWNAASHANPSHTNPISAVSNVWNAASHANPPHISTPGSAVSHVWNAAAHATDYNRPPSPAIGNAWNRIENYLHPQSTDPVRSAWNHIPHPSSPPPPANYPPPNYPPQNYPPQNYSPPPPSNYPPPNYSPPPPSNYPSFQQPPPPGSAASSVLGRLLGGGAR
ncbi:unnamed protein product [Adineta ricciae]|uniref:Uncharacterized protein n=1 Tax=Adineta ricciae TaxID=249248 RepID=A0A813UM34_ADIRI|nr:unnamed protein product [Adineta ricciae]